VTLARGGLGVEAHARAARYQAFQDTLNAGEVLVTADSAPPSRLRGR
jgi:tRNA(Ile)-lysidine synthase